MPCILDLGKRHLLFSRAPFVAECTARNGPFPEENEYYDRGISATDCAEAYFIHDELNCHSNLA